MEIDVKWGIKLRKHCFWCQYTAIDVCSRWRYLAGYDNQDNSYAINFVSQLTSKAPFTIKAIRTDNHAIFTNRYTGYTKSDDPLNPRIHPLDIYLEKQRIEHLLIDPGKPQQNPFVERSHRTDEEYFYQRLIRQPKTLQEYQLLLSLWCMTYNTREHESLNGLTPLEYLARSA